MRRLIKWVVAATIFMALGAALNQPKSHRTAARSVAGQTSADAATPTPEATATPERHRRKRLAVAAVATPAAAPAAPVFVACDAHIQAMAGTTTCPFAENVFYEYYEKTLGYATSATLRAWSPAAAQVYRVRCEPGTVIDCTAGDGAEIKFSSAAVAAYDDNQASAYAASHDTGDATPSDSTSDTSPGSANLNPNSYDSGAGASDGPNPSNEIENYGNGTGYPVQCADGMWSQSGGRPGACSGHGGEE